MDKIIKLATEIEIEEVEEFLIQFNENTKPRFQEESSHQVAYVIIENDIILGGCVGYASLYYIGYIDTLWVKESHRGRGLGAQLLEKVEGDLKSFGCSNCYLETFDFQAPEFYK